MAVNLIAHDSRLEGRTPSASRDTFTITVNESTTLDDFFEQALDIAVLHAGIRRLSIMAHGLYVRDLDTTAIQFCSDLISYQTVHYFSRLRGLVDIDRSLPQGTQAGSYDHRACNRHETKEDDQGRHDMIGDFVRQLRSGERRVRADDVLKCDKPKQDESAQYSH